MPLPLWGLCVLISIANRIVITMLADCVSVAFVVYGIYEFLFADNVDTSAFGFHAACRVADENVYVIACIIQCIPVVSVFFLLICQVSDNVVHCNHVMPLVRAAVGLMLLNVY